MTAPDVRAILADANKSFRQKWDHETWDDFYVAKAEWDLAALEAAGLVICAEQIGWWRENTAAHAGAWIPLAIEPNQPRDYVPVYVPLSARPEE